jgi:hypothetical protein
MTQIFIRNGYFQTKSLPDAPSSAEQSGDFGEDCLSEASSAAARLIEQHRELRRSAAEGALLLWSLSFGQAKESDLPPGNPGLVKSPRSLKQIG